VPDGKIKQNRRKFAVNRETKFTLGDQMTITLTKPQKLFLLEYLPDICHGNRAWLKDATRSEFVEMVSSMDFDCASPCSSGKIKTAMALHKKEILLECDVRKDHLGESYLYVEFSDLGADMLFDLMNKEINHVAHP